MFCRGLGPCGPFRPCGARLDRCRRFRPLHRGPPCGFLGPLRTWRLGHPRRNLVRIERHEGSWLIRREFLADFAGGFGGIRVVSGASSHAAFNFIRADTGIPYLPTALQILCTPSHTILYWERQTIGARGSAQNGKKRVLISSPLAPNATIKSLVEVPVGSCSSRRTQASQNKFKSQLQRNSRRTETWQ